MKHLSKNILLGLSAGDALGVPVEFMSRLTLDQKPVTDMTGYGTHYQPAGTWSDDSSLAFCLAEALTQDFSLQTIADLFARWYHESYWTAHNNVFDIGMATREAIYNIRKGEKPEYCGGRDEHSNGNGSLMRILPLLPYLNGKTEKERFETVRGVSSITHGHIRSVVACYYYLEFARLLAAGKDKYDAYRQLQREIPGRLQQWEISEKEILLFSRLLHNNIDLLPRENIYSSGYVLHTLEASVWCLLTTGSYKEAVLKAVNLGNDTDTTGAVTGGLAGIVYGAENIPQYWLAQLARLEDIIDLAERVDKKYNL